MEEIIDKIFNKAKKPLSFERLCEKLNLTTDSEKMELKKILDSKVEDYSVYQTPKGQYVSMMKTSFRVGRFYANRSGGGTVVVDNSYTTRKGNYHVEEISYAIDRDHAHGAIDGDLVFMDSFVKDKKGILGGTVQKIIDRNLNVVMGEVYRLGDHYFVKPIDKKKSNLIIALEGEAIEGQRVAVSLDSCSSDNFYSGTIQRTFNHKDDPDEDILWEAFKCGIDDQFSKDSLEQVSYIPKSVLDSDKIGRMDLTDWEIFTIDGEDTKDIDDALSCKRLENGNYLVGVHIADVSYYVPVGSPLDKDAFQKGTSVYLAGKVIPMLPHELSNGICSLNPQVPRLALSCIMEVTPEGKVVRSDFWQSVIQSCLKMSYTKVNEILKEGKVDPQYIEHVDALKNLNKLALILRKNRVQSGAIEFERGELGVSLNEDGVVDGFKIRKQDVGENLIEEFMLLANETVAKSLSQRGIPCLYRVHGKPSEARLEEFIRMLHLTGNYYNQYSPFECYSDPKALQDLAEYVHQTGKLSNMLSGHMIRCMSRAKYSPINSGHYGLAKDYYCHFTSPIRRYPDLTVHRLIRDCLFDSSHFSKNTKVWKNKLPEIGSHSSKMERAADEAEMHVLKMRCAEYMQQHIGEDYEGTVIGLGNSGLQIQLDNYIEGKVRMQNLSGDYVYCPETFTLISLRGKDDYYIGDRLSLKVKDASKENKTVDFTINQKIEENSMKKVSQYNQKVKAKVLEERAGRISQ